jgi:Flp pilus assembly pilin Flp
MKRWRDSKLLQREREAGQGLAEYALILALIALLAVAALLFMGGAITDFLDQLGQCLGNPASC